MEVSIRAGSRDIVASGKALAELNHLFDETMDVSMLFDQAPVEPANFVVLAIRIVVAVLRAAEFIARQNHWYALA